MRYGRTTGSAVCASSLVTLLVSATGLGSPAAEECFGLPATLVGSDVTDVLVGTEGNDVSSDSVATTLFWDRGE